MSDEIDQADEAVADAGAVESILADPQPAPEPDVESEAAAEEEPVTGEEVEPTAFVPWQDEQGNWVTEQLVMYEQHVWEAQVASYQLATGQAPPTEPAEPAE